MASGQPAYSSDQVIYSTRVVYSYATTISSTPRDTYSTTSSTLPVYDYPTTTSTAPDYYYHATSHTTTSEHPYASNNSEHCVQCPPYSPSCLTSCGDGEMCSLVPADCQTCAHMVCIRNPNVALPQNTTSTGLKSQMDGGAGHEEYYGTKFKVAFATLATLVIIVILALGGWFLYRTLKRRRTLAEPRSYAKAELDGIWKLSHPSLQEMNAVASPKELSSPSHRVRTLNSVRRELEGDLVIFLSNSRG